MLPGTYGRRAGDSSFSLVLSQNTARENRMLQVVFFQELTFVPQLVSVHERVTPVAKAARCNL